MNVKSMAPFFDKTRLAALPVNLFLAGKVATVALALIVFVLSAHTVVAGPHPKMYLNQAEIDVIKSKISGGEEPWASAYTEVMAEADLALTQGLESVTFGGPGTPGSNRYASRRGDDTNFVRHDYFAAIRLSDKTRSLGLAYAFTGEARYAVKAIDLIRHWSLSPATRMSPIPGNSIETFITMPGYYYGADLILDYEGWDPAEKADFLGWVSAMGNRVRNKGEGNNNFSNWRVVMLASTGALLDDQSYLDVAKSEFERMVPIQIAGSGSSKAGQLGWEVKREEGGLHYSLFAINAMIQGAEILNNQGFNMYDYTDPSTGGNLRLALDFITPYALNPETWGKTQEALERDGYVQPTVITVDNSMALFELAYSYWQDPAYLAVLNKWGRPIDDIRPMGNTTLTHANRFSTVEPMAPSIVTQPEDATVMESEDATFNVVATGSGSLEYQWYRGNSPITGATSASYTVMAVSSLDNGSVYSSVITNNEGSVSSNEVMLTVEPDDIAPILLSAVAVNDTRVDILFSEAVNGSSAEATGNYQLDLSIEVMAASLSDDGRTVSLAVSELSEDTAYTVLVSNIEDFAENPNTIIAQSSQSFTYRSADGFEDGNADGWEPLTEARWRVVMDEGDMAYHLNTTIFENLSGGRLGEYSLLSGRYGDFTMTFQARLGDDVAGNTLADYAVVFGYQNPENYYFAMFNNQQSSTQLFKVIDGERIELGTPASSDRLNDNGYHSIEVSRTGSLLNVLFDGSLILSADDSDLGAGRVGVGSYNDAAYFDDVSITGESSITPDTTAPVITLTGDNPQTIIVGTAYTELGATATDDVDGDITTVMSDAAAVNTDVIGSYEVTYNVSDKEGNAAVQVIRIVNVVVMTDSTPPVITLTGSNPQTITVGTVYAELGATATDDVDGDITLVMSDAAAVDTDVIGSYEVTYNVSDKEGNAAVQVIRIVNVVAMTDSTAPVITLTGSNPQTITVGTAYTELGATATDDVDGDITPVMSDTAAVNTNVTGSYIVTYSVTDGADNTAQATRTVNVIAAGGDGSDDSDGGGALGGLFAAGLLLLTIRRRRQGMLAGVKKSY
ncbi:MAG: DUF5011 domain-containing protein [Gammaproteobacteria bacterium]|nr:DUF5011 domain-containing protein [Gammaproteobacteria bacterium]